MKKLFNITRTIVKTIIELVLNILVLGGNLAVLAFILAPFIKGGWSFDGLIPVWESLEQAALNSLPFVASIWRFFSELWKFLGEQQFGDWVQKGILIWMVLDTIKYFWHLRWHHLPNLAILRRSRTISAAGKVGKMTSTKSKGAQGEVTTTKN